MRRPIAVFLVAPMLVPLACNETDPNAFPKPDAGTQECVLDTPEAFLTVAKDCPEQHASCALKCGQPCAEPATPFDCPALRPWAAMPHASACGSFDGTTIPMPPPGKCTATAPTGAATAYPGPDPQVPGRFHLGEGHWIQPAGKEQILTPNEVVSAFTVDQLLVPGTRFAVVIDAGVRDNAIYTVDLDEVASGNPGLRSTIAFPRPQQLDMGLAFVAPNRVYASGGASGVVYAFTIDTTTGALARDVASDLDLGPGAGSTGRFYVGALAPSLDGSRLLVAPAIGDGALRVVTLATKAVASIDLGGTKEVFDLVRDPNGDVFWATALDTRQLLRIDLATSQVVAKVPTGKNPEGIGLLGGTHVAVANADDDTLDVFDATGTKVQTLSLRQDGLTGSQPSTMAYDAAQKRLYVTLSGINAVGVYAFDASSSAPLLPLGEIPTAWWPTDVELRPDGSLSIITAKGHGVGPALDTSGGLSDGTTPDLTKGSIAVVPSPDAGTLAVYSQTVLASRRTTPAEGFPTVECPGGAPYDFPIPLTNTGAPSSQIKYVVYVVRENKTFDGIMGDLPGVNGDSKLVMSPGRMDEFWPNVRTIARTWANFDNFYVAAEQSLQGHVWTAFGRSTDWVERTWSSTWGRGVRTPRAGIDRNVGSPAEGSLFLWAERNKIPYDDMGEIVGVGDQGLDVKYPGLVYSLVVPDTDKACYIAARARATCDLRPLTYVVLPNDHTKGTSEGNVPTPELYIAVNDAGSGLILDAISHSPMWPNALVIYTEDDPQNGADHVDGHRTILVMASPWVKKGYVSKTKLDMASIHKLLAHVFAKPYQSEMVANAAIPFDAFTSTPDFTPYVYQPLRTALTCNPAKDFSPPAQDWSVPDSQPGVNEQVTARMREIARAPR
jgi:DNA-binding beta-propeller fold protein YncE